MRHPKDAEFFQNLPQLFREEFINSTHRAQFKKRRYSQENFLASASGGGEADVN